MRLIDADKLNLWPVLRPYCSTDVCCEVMDIINGAPTANQYEWISVKDALPEDNNGEYYDAVIIALSTGRVVCGCYRNHDKEWWGDMMDGQYSDITNLVTHWMPLPTPPITKEN
jgi:hypothetical protein